MTLWRSGCDPETPRPIRLTRIAKHHSHWLQAMSMIEWWGSSRSWARPKIKAKHQSGGLHQTAILMLASLRLHRGDASPNSSDAYNQTPLFWAARMGLLKCYCSTGMLTQTLRIRRTLVSLAAERGYDTVAELPSVPNSLVHSRSFLGVLGRATPGKVRTGRTIADHSPSPWASCTSQAEIIHLQTNHFHIVRHHSCRPRPSPSVPLRPPPALS